MKKKKKITISVDAIAVSFLQKHNVESISKICNDALLQIQKEIQHLINLYYREIIPKKELDLELLKYQNHEEYVERKRKENEEYFINDFKEKRKIADARWTTDE